MKGGYIISSDTVRSGADGWPLVKMPGGPGVGLVGRCSGSFHIGTLFRKLWRYRLSADLEESGTREFLCDLDLEVTRIEVYRRSVFSLSSGYTGLVTLSGDGIESLVHYLSSQREEVPRAGVTLILEGEVDPAKACLFFRTDEPVLAWLLRKTGGPVLVCDDAKWSPESTRKSWLEIPGRRWFTLESRAMSDASRMHDHLKEVLELPASYGRSLNALIDCLTDEAVMSGTGSVLSIRDVHHLLVDEPGGLYEALLQMLVCAADRWAALGNCGNSSNREAIPLRVILTGPGAEAEPRWQAYRKYSQEEERLKGEVVEQLELYPRPG